MKSIPVKWKREPRMGNPFDEFCWRLYLQHPFEKVCLAQVALGLACSNESSGMWYTDPSLGKHFFKTAREAKTFVEKKLGVKP